MRTSFLFFTLLMLVLSPASALATSHGTGPAVIGGDGPAVIGGPAIDRPNVVDSEQDVITVLNRITNWIFTIFLIVSVIMIIWSAFLYLTSQGGENVKKAHQTLLYAAIAIAVAMLSKGIVALIASLVTTGV